MKGKKAIISEQIRQAIKDSGLSFYKLANLSGINDKIISKFFHGNSDTRISNIEAIADALELEIIVKPKKEQQRK